MNHVAAAFLSLTCAAGLSACATSATSKQAPATQTADASSVHCTYEKTVGSNLMQKVCTTEAQRQQQAAQGQDVMNSSRKRRDSSPTSAGVGR